MIEPPIGLEDLGLTLQQIEEFIKGARVAYGFPKLPKTEDNTLGELVIPQPKR